MIALHLTKKSAVRVEYEENRYDVPYWYKHACKNDLYQEPDLLVPHDVRHHVEGCSSYKHNFKDVELVKYIVFFLLKAANCNLELVKSFE